MPKPADTYFQQAPGSPVLPRTPVRFILHFVARYPGWYFAVLILEGLHAGCGILLPYAIGEIVQSVTQANLSKEAVLEQIQTPLYLFVALSIGEVVAARAAGTIQITIGPLQRHNVTRALYAYLQHHSHRYLSSNFSGALAQWITDTSLGVIMTLWTLLFDFWPIAIVFAVSITLLYGAHPQLAAFVGVWAVLFVTIAYWLATRCQPYALNAAIARSETTGKVVDAATNLSTTRLFAHLDFERKELDKQLASELKAVRKSNGYAERVRWFQFISAAILKIGTLYFALELWRKGAIDVAQFVMATSLSLLIITEARNLSRRFLEFFEYVGNVANGVHSIIQAHEVIDRPLATTQKIKQGAIEFSHLNFSYEHSKPVFSNLSVHIKPGQRVGLVGYSGSGKSTFVSLLLRFYDHQTGHILIDGINIHRIAQDSLRAQIGLIPQEPTLFHRTLMENIRYGRLDASDEEVIAAAKLAHAHDFIITMKEGYHSLVGERGVKLSGGQRQRIAIARVILKNAPILILDEATSSLDSITETAIQETLDKVMQNKTVIVVAHRLSTIAHLDRILVFDRGNIVEDGTHKELLAQNGLYTQLWNNQVGGFLFDEQATTATLSVLVDQLAKKTTVRYARLDDSNEQTAIHYNPSLDEGFVIPTT